MFDFVKELFGNDPQKAAIMAGAQPAPAPTDAPAAGPAIPIAGGPAAPAPGAPPAPSAPPAAGGTAPPPDLGAIYERLLADDRRRRGMDSGMTLIAAGLTKSPETRQSLIKMAGDSGQQGDGPSTSLQMLMKLQSDQQAKLIRAQQLARLPELAKKFGIDAPTANYLFETGKLDELMKDMSKPDVKITQLNDGRTVGIDNRTNQIVKEYGGVKAKDDTVLQGQDGQIDIVSGDRKSVNTLRPGEPKPNYQAIKLDTGETVAFDSRSGTSAGTVGAAKPKEPTVLQGPDGQIDLVAADKASVSTLRGAAPKLIPIKLEDGRTIMLNPANGRMELDLGGVKPPTPQIVRLEDGRTVAINPVEGKVTAEFGGVKPKEATIVPGADGQINVVDPDKTSVRQLQAASPKTTDLTELDRVNKERAAKDMPAISAEHWLAEANKQRAEKTTTDHGNNKLAEGFAKTVWNEYDNAKSHHAAALQVRNAQQLLDTNEVRMGSRLAPLEAEARKIVGHVFGLPPDKAAGTTEAFNSAMKEMVLPKIKALGSGTAISNADLQFTNDAVGSNELTPDGVRRILRATEMGSAIEIARYNRDIDRHIAQNPEAAKYTRKMDMPTLNESYLMLPNGNRIPQDYIDLLYANPHNVAEFDRKFGDSKIGSYLLALRGAQ